MVRTLALVPHGHGVDLRGGRLGRELVKRPPGRVVARQGRHGHVRAVCLLRQREVLVVAVVVRGPREERGHLVDGAPLLGGRLAGVVRLRKRQGGKQRAAVEHLVGLRKAASAVPHHRAEVGLELRVARIIAARGILRVVLAQRGVACGGHGEAALVEEGRRLDAVRRVDKGKLRVHGLLHLRRDLGKLGRAGVQKRGAHGEEPGAQRGGRLPLRAGERLELPHAGDEHAAGQLAELGTQAVALAGPEQVGEIEMVRVHHGVHGDEAREEVVAVALVQLEELATARHERLEETPLGKSGRLGVREVGVGDVGDVGEVGRPGVVHAGRHLVGVLGGIRARQLLEEHRTTGDTRGVGLTGSAGSTQRVRVEVAEEPCIRLARERCGGGHPGRSPSGCGKRPAREKRRPVGGELGQGRRAAGTRGHGGLPSSRVRDPAGRTVAPV